MRLPQKYLALHQKYLNFDPRLQQKQTNPRETKLSNRYVQKSEVNALTKSITWVQLIIANVNESIIKPVS